MLMTRTNSLALIVMVVTVGPRRHVSQGNWRILRRSWQLHRYYYHHYYCCYHYYEYYSQGSIKPQQPMVTDKVLTTSTDINYVCVW